MKSIYCYFIFLLYFSTGCTNASNNRIIFTTNNFKEIKGKNLLPELFIGQPLNMHIIGNNLLFIDKYENKQITSININNKSDFKRIGNQGEGPNEFINIRNITYNTSNNSICIFDGMSRNYYFYKFNGNKVELTEKNLLQKYRFNENCPYDIIPFGNKFIANGCFDKKQFAILDNESNIISKFGIYPGDKSGIDISNCYFLKNQTIITSNPKQDCFVAAGVFNDQLVFYKSENNKMIKIKEYFSIDSKIKTLSSKDGKNRQYSSSETPETIRAYRVLYSTKDNLYALYWGIENKNFNKKNKECYILKFDWNGNLKSGYKINRLIKTFAVDDASNKIYAITYSEDEECTLMQYNMN